MKNLPGIIQWTDRFVRCGDCSLKNQCFPGYLSGQELVELESKISFSRRYIKGGYLHYAGDRLTEFVIIKSGSAKTAVISEDGLAQIVAFHFPGDLLGLDSINNKLVLTSTVFLEDSVACSIPWKSIVALSTRAPQLLQEIITRFSSELACCHKHVQLMSQHSSEQRLALFLLDLARRQQKRSLSDEQLVLSMSRHDIGNYLGLASETVSRLIGKFERKGWIKADSRRLRLINHLALKNTDSPCEVCDSAAIQAYT